VAWRSAMFCFLAHRAARLRGASSSICRWQYLYLRPLPHQQGWLRPGRRDGGWGAHAGYRFGDAKEIPFTLDPSVPAPVDGAPGSASVRLGAAIDRQTPLESWLSILFGPAA